MSFTENLFVFASLPFTTCPSILNTRSLAALVVITQNVFIARSLRAGNSSLWSRHRGECVSIHPLCPTRGRVEVPVYHVPRTGGFPRVHWYLGLKLVFSFLILTQVILCTNLISKYALVLSLTLNLPMASQFGSQIKSIMQSLPLQLVLKCSQ